MDYKLETDSMDSKERVVLGDALLFEGELKLLKGDFSGTDLFDMAAKLDPENPEIFFRQGLSLFEFGSREGKEKTLLTANKKFRVATQINPEYFDAWHVWGNSLMMLGMTFREHHYFLEAEDKLRKAIALLDKQDKDSSVKSQLYWDFGVVWYHMAMHSTEPCDFHAAIDAFQKAASYPERLPAEFWNDFGNACLELAPQVNDIRLCVKATNCFKQGSTTFEGWSGLARALQMLYEQTHDEDHFTQASECYSSAAGLNPHDAEVWENWGKFLCDSGKRLSDPKRLSAAIEKCHRSYTISSENPVILGIWAEALATLGELTEKVELIYEAQNKIAEAIEQGDGLHEVWYSAGVVCTSLGNYLNDVDCYFQAIERFQEGVSLDRTQHRLWHAIALTYIKIGRRDEDLICLERAHKFFMKALELNPSSFYQIDYAFALSKLGDLSDEQKWLEQAVYFYEKALNTQKNAIYIHPEWLFHYACTLDSLGEFYDDDSFFTKAIEILSHVLMIDPDFSGIHHRIALTFAHLGDLTNELDPFYRALHHYRLSSKHEEDNDKVIYDFATTLLHISQATQDHVEADQMYREAEHKLIQAARLGNRQAFYQLGCLYSLLGQYEKAIRFIQKASAFGALPPVEELLADEWLDGLRSTADFREFLYNLERK